MGLFERSNVIKSKFFDRCINYPKYIITFYTADKEASEEVFREVTEYFNGDGTVLMVTFDDNYKIEFVNGSVISIISTEHIVPGLWSHLIFMDSRIREVYIKDKIKPTIDQYVTGEESAMLNPKPIYLKYEN